MLDFQNISSSLHEMLTSFIEDGPFTGLAIGIVKGNNLSFTGEYGTANVLTGAPVGPDSLFHQASVSKTFVATAIIQLVQRGRIDLDSPVTRYLSYFKMEDERFHRLTIRQLLNHTSGMPDEEDYAWDRPEYDEQSLERYVKGISRHKLLSEAGEKFAYSNIGYEILGDVISKVSGMSFEEYMHNHILEPAGMRSSSFLKKDIEAKLTAPHVLDTLNGYGGHVSSVFPYNRAHAPSSTLYTNAADMCRYLQMHLNRGTAENGCEILQSGSYDEMWKPQAATGYGEDHAQVGLGWFMGKYKGTRVLSHSGWDTGFLSNLLLFPDDNMAVSIMTNCDYVWLGSITDPILDILFGSDISMIKRSVAHKIAALAVDDGEDKAAAEYERINRLEPEKYYLQEFEFMRISEALEWSGRKEEAIRVLRCASIIFPDSSAISDRLQEYIAMS